VNDAADLIKAFLRELTTPLLPSEHFSTHIAIADMKDVDGNIFIYFFFVSYLC